MPTYYNEIAPHAAQRLRSLIADGLLPAGDVDERSIRDVRPGDLQGYTACHFFAGIGGWPYAGRLAGWPDDRPWWTGSPPCQPHSIANPDGLGTADLRHLWPEYRRLIRACRPAVAMGEQVKNAVGTGWLDEVARDLAADSYAFRPVVVAACAVGSFQRRDRIFFVAHPRSEGLSRAEQPQQRRPGSQAAEVGTATAERDRCAPWRSYRQQRGADGVARMVQPGIRLLAHGIPNRVDVLTELGNAIVPQLAAEAIEAWMDVTA